MQMYAMRYGAVPVVRKTGGLADRYILTTIPTHDYSYLFRVPPTDASVGFDTSVFDVDGDNVAEEKRNGFTFTEATEEVSDHSLLH